MGEENYSEHSGAAPWDPLRHLRAVSSLEARLSRGFLRSRPEKWLPGFAAHWLPLAHSLGATVKMAEVKPVISFPDPNPESSFAGSVDGEPLLVSFAEDAVMPIVEAVAPGATREASQIVLEYLVRRLIASLISCWSGPQASVVRFEPEMSKTAIQGVSAVQLAIDINTSRCKVWIILGNGLAERLDGLWRRQLRAAQKQNDDRQAVRIELTELAVPPTMIVDYLNPGSVIDLETPIGDIVTLRHGGKGWLHARLCNIEGRLGLEALPRAVSSLTLPEGTTRIAVEFSELKVENRELPELSQPGAIWDTGLPLTDRVNMVINGEKVAEGSLLCYQGGFFLSVG